MGTSVLSKPDTLLRNLASYQNKGLISWWPGFPNNSINLYDMSGYGKHGQYVGTLPTQGLWVPGKDGGKNALNFQTALNSVININSTVVANAQTYAFWIKPNLSLQGSFGCITHGSALGNNVGIYLRNTGVFTVLSPGTNNSGSAIPDKVWTHVVITEDGTNSLCYFNGVLDSTTANIYGILAVNFTYIGNDGSNDGLSGYLEDLRFYNRILSPREILSLFKQRSRWALRYKPNRIKYFDLGVAPDVPVAVHSDKIKTNPETPLVFQPSGNAFPSGIGFPSGYIVNFRPDLLPGGSGCNSATFDLGPAPRTSKYEWRGKAVLGMNTSLGADVEAYIATSNSVIKDGFLSSGVASVITNSNKRRNLLPCGSMVCDMSVAASSTPDPAQAAGTVEIFGRYVSLMWWNNASQALGTGSYFVLTPIPQEIQ